MASSARGSRSSSERLPSAIRRLFVALDEDPRLEGKGLAAAFAAAFPDLPDEVSSLAATEVARVAVQGRRFFGWIIEPRKRILH